MPLFTKLRYLSFLIIFVFISLFIYSCKNDDDVAGPGDDTDTDDPALTVLTPATGETLTAGGAYNITWQSNLTTEVKIEYSTDNGSTWVVITSSTVNDGLFTWDPVPNLESQQCRIRVTTIDNTVTDVNTGMFIIEQTVSKLLNLTQPNGGEILYTGQSYTITWISNEVAQVKIEFSSNNGTSWNTIAPNYPADSSYYSWDPVPDIITTNGLVRISDISTDTLTDQSQSVFAIGKPQSISVLSPNGEEQWPAKSRKVITWNSSQVSSVKIEYSNNNGVDWYTIAASTESDGYYEWEPLPEIPSTNAKIRISDTDGYPSDESDNVFTVLPEDALTLVQPNGGEQWLSGSKQVISWNSYKTTGKVVGNGGKKSAGKNDDILNYIPKSPQKLLNVSSVKLEYTTNSGAQWNSIAENIDNNGSYTWTSVPSANSSLCKVRISDMQDGTPFDISDSLFTIYNTVQQELVVTSPNGGEIWQAGTSQNITWSSTNIASVKIEYTTDNGLLWSTIIANTPSDGYYTWTQVPASSSTNCRIKISDAEDNFPYDFSNAVFTIAPEPEITVISPNGGESLRSGSNTSIKWTSTNISDVKLEYTTNNGASWKTITNSTPSDGIFEWDVDSINSNLCRIKISDVQDSQPSDISDNNFAITNQVVQSLILLNPNGSEVWEAGTSHNLTWSASGVTTIKVELTTNNGLSWSVIATDVASTGSFEWTPIDINSTQCKIRISDALDGLPVDESDGSFTVQPIQTLAILVPYKDQVIVAGESFDIKWEAVGIEKVRIEYTTENSQSNSLGWTTLVDSVPSKGLNGSYTTSFSYPSTNYRVRICDASDETPMVSSVGTFTVSPQQTKTITVTSPNGGENWLAGGEYEIRWTSTNIERILIQYTLDGGANWQDIDEVVSNGLYNWTIPKNINFRSDLCRIKLVYILGDSVTTLYDMTDDYFSIHPQSKLLRVLFPNGGETINPDTQLDTVFQWTSAGITDVKIELSLDNGISWSTIVSKYKSNGAYRWTLWPMDSTSTNARLRISDASSDAGSSPLTDMSDSYFSLNIWEPALKIINPGPKLIGGKDAVIKWYCPKGVNRVKLEYSVDGGKSWRLISDNVSSNSRKLNQYSWKSVPPDKTGEALLRVTDSTGRNTVSSKFRMNK
jgi:hypothetical protein